MLLIKRLRRKIGRLRADNRVHKFCAGRDGVYLTKREFPELTSEEWAQCKAAWPSIKLKKEDMAWARIYKAECGFSPYMIGLYQCCAIRKVMNPKIELHAFDNKALCDVYFPELQFAAAYVRRIKGVLYDGELKPITFEQAVETLLTKECYFIKPALDTCQGTGVEKVDITGDEAADRKAIAESFERQRFDFVAQEPLKQHPAVAALNPTSVNCCRITTIYINGRFASSTVLKIGKAGAVRDNWNVSYLVKVSDDGTLADFGYDNDLNKVTRTDNGISFGGFKLPRFDEMLSSVEHYHKSYFPNCGMIGWDVILDENDKVRLIEMNITMPGFLAEQLCCGTFFEPFAKEINERIKAGR